MRFPAPLSQPLAIVPLRLQAELTRSRAETERLRSEAGKKSDLDLELDRITSELIRIRNEGSLHVQAELANRREAELEQSARTAAAAAAEELSAMKQRVLTFEQAAEDERKKAADAKKAAIEREEELNRSAAAVSKRYEDEVAGLRKRSLQIEEGSSAKVKRVGGGTSDWF
ncbi:MAG: hypothetical protein SGPRY_000752 [Prymnesium sp.]